MLLAAAPLPADDGATEGVASGEGVTEVPAGESDCPDAETPGVAADGPTPAVVAVADGALAELAATEASPVEAGGVPVGVGGGDSEVAGVVPVGVAMPEVAVVGAGKIADVDELVAALDVDVVELEDGVDVPM